MATLHRPAEADERSMPLPCPFCESHPIVRTVVAASCTFFRCRWCRKVWGVPVVSRPN